jgi:ABC-type polysaccharide/polyol phosphate export permease
VIALFRSLFKNRRLLKEFVVRDLKARYVGSGLGFFWSVIFPIINLVVYMYVFRLILNQRFSDKSSPAETALWMLAGITVWAAFAETISRATNTLVENANLIKKVVFPCELLPAYLIASSMINMMIGIPIVIAGVAYFAVTEPRQVASLMPLLEDAPERFLALGLPLVALPLCMLLQAVFSLGLGCFLATLNVFLRDTFHLVGVFTTVWMFATPIFYPAIMVHNARGGAFRWILSANPMHWLIECYREILLFAQWPDWSLMLRFGVVALVVCFLGGSFFMSQRHHFADLL